MTTFHMEDLLIFIISFLVLLMFLLWQLKFKEGKALDERLRTLQGKTALNNTNGSAVNASQKNLREQIFKSFQNIAQKQLGVNYKEIFDRAGIRTSSPGALYSVLKVGFLIGFMILYIILMNSIPALSNLSFVFKLAVLIACILAGLRGADVYLKWHTKIRYKMLKRDLTSALDLLVICTNSGLSLERSFESVAIEIGYSNVELGREFALTAIELSILPDRRQALKNLSSRIELPLVQDMVTTLIQAEEQGTAVAQSLKILSGEFQKKKVLEIETKAARLPALLAIPLVSLILPSLFIVILGPVIIELVENFNF